MSNIGEMNIGCQAYPDYKDSLGDSLNVSTTKVHHRHPRAGGEPGEGKYKIMSYMLGHVKQWAPAFAGVTGRSV